MQALDEAILVLGQRMEYREAMDKVDELLALLD